MVAARILSSCGRPSLGDWRLATVNVRTSIRRAQRLAARAATLHLTREEFAARMVPSERPCEVGEEPDGQLLHPVVRAAPGAAAGMTLAT